VNIMSAQVTIDDFVERLMRLRPGGLLGFNGAASGILGTSNTGSDLTLQLQRKAIEFSQLYKSTPTMGALEIKARELRGLLMAAAAVGAIAQNLADELIETLQTLTKKRDE
jgi:hypothetical protein